MNLIIKIQFLYIYKLVSIDVTELAEFNFIYAYNNSFVCLRNGKFEEIMHPIDKN